MILLQRQKIANLSTGNKIYNNLVPSYLKKKPCTISQVYQKFRIKFQSTQSEKLYHSKIQTRNIQNFVRFLLDQQMEQLKLNHKKWFLVHRFQKRYLIKPNKTSILFLLRQATTLSYSLSRVVVSLIFGRFFFL